MRTALLATPAQRSVSLSCARARPRRRQVNAESWARQAQLWGEMVLAYCRHHRIYRLDLNEHLSSPLFKNDKIGRTGPVLSLGCHCVHLHMD